MIESPYIFIGQWGRQLTRQRVWQIVSEAAQRAGLSHVSPHMLRRSVATHMVDRRADLRTVQTILGHADISTTQVYLKVWPKLLREELLRCHPRENPGRKQLRLFGSSVPALLPGPAPCEECASPAVTGRTRCERHLLRAKIARNKFYGKKRAKKPAKPAASADRRKRA